MYFAAQFEIFMRSKKLIYSKPNVMKMVSLNFVLSTIEKISQRKREKAQKERGMIQFTFVV